MAQRIWFITGVSSGFGRELAEQLSAAATAWSAPFATTGQVADLRQKYPDTFRREVLDVTDTAAIRDVSTAASRRSGASTCSSATPATACSARPRN